MSLTTHQEIATQIAQCLDISLEPTQSKLTLIKTYKARRLLEVLNEEDQSAVLSNFAARFLPSLVAAYKHIPGTPHAYDWILSKISLLATPYFAKFLRNPMGWDLYVFHAERLIEMGIPSPKTLPLGIMEAILIFLQLMLYATRKTVPLSDETRLRAIIWLNNAVANSQWHLSNLPALKPVEVACHDAICCASNQYVSHYHHL
ncbi:hypothetical protein B0H11DRAFT_2232266 [Mycena galericulata]|nr:hypothetical protein B0H11DRAFT_2232266 [Mycena galericulata]